MSKKDEIVNETEEEVGPRTAKRAVGITKEAALTVLVENNVKRPGSAAYDRFEGYLTTPPPATVQAALDNGLTIGDIKFDLIHGSIEVEGASVEEYEVTARGPRTPKEEGEEEEETVESEEGEDF